MSISKSGGVVRIARPGAPEVLTYETVAFPEPGAKEVLIGQKAIGVNFLDVLFRDGRFPSNAYPAPIGLEAAGVIEATGEGVTDFGIGDRVAYYAAPGAYAEKRLIREEEIFRLPEDITFEQAAAVMIKGLTAQMLIKHSYEIRAGEFVLIQAMTGGVGSLLSAWARSIGAVVIGTVGSPAKKKLAIGRGFGHVIDLQHEDFSERVASITQGAGVDVVYDSMGKATFDQFVKLVRKGGTIVSYGAATGWPEPDGDWMKERGVRFVQGVLNAYPGYQDKKGEAALEVFDQVRSGVFDLEQPAVYALADAAAAHADLEARRTTGSVILKP